MSQLSERPHNPAVGVAIPHESAAQHVTGVALYTDDLVQRTKDVLHAPPGPGAARPHARVTALRTEPALAMPGVVRVLTAADCAGGQRRRGEARRAAVPQRGHVPRARGLLGTRGDPRGGPARRVGRRG